MMRNDKGITLVALAVTVIVLVIILLITVDTTVNEDLVGKTENATSNYEASVLTETLKTILVSERSLYDDGFISKDTMWTNITKTIENNADLKQYGTITVTEEADAEGNEYLAVSIGERHYEITIDKVVKK